ncbi:MAG TPA: T9SS type A sorting domain-containing protein [Puia sp.]|uniref:T9SS type A sorting domain-containing protein n=1 Tax=Puia sp. TaxID=2045100 RepID=UPI002C249F65|nr:T9SS type A sorting domain-containing protein [Puia sp.]HVU96526.1 T9SS type A sorting domain-containing protein [Puia sp.]
MPNCFRTLPCLLVILCVLCNYSVAQCLLAPPTPACTGTEPLAIDGETINASISHWYYGATASFNSLTLNGGTLIVCGNLTVDKFTFNTGTLYVLPGASFTIGSGISTTLQLQGGCYLYNYGTITVHRGFALDNAHVSASQPNIVINATSSSVFSVPYDWFVINNAYSWFVNNGKADMHGIVTDPLSAAGSVCLGSGSQTAMSILINNAPNPYAAPSGPGCVSVHDHSYICESVTVDAGVRACLSASHITDSSCFVSRGHVKAWGNASIFSSCTACAAIATLPLSFLSFSAAAGNRSNRLNWQLTGDAAAYPVRIERSADGSYFLPLLLAIAAGASGDSYTAYDPQPLAGTSYYRIVYTHPVTGAEIVSPVKEVSCEQSVPFGTYPNPFTSGFSIRLSPGPAPAEIALLTADGKRIRQLYVNNNGNGVLDIRTDRELPPGLYTLKVIINDQSYFKQLLKQ